MKFNYSKLRTEIKAKQFKQMLTEQRKIGIREYATDIGISAPTLSRIQTGSKMDIDTILKLCAWLNKPIQNFIS